MSASGSRAARDGAALPISDVNQLSNAGNFSSDSLVGDTHAPSASAAISASASSRAGSGGGGGRGGRGGGSGGGGGDTGKKLAEDDAAAAKIASAASTSEKRAGGEAVAAAAAAEAACPPPAKGELIRAAREGDNAVVASLIVRGADIHEMDWVSQEEIEEETKNGRVAEIAAVWHGQSTRR